MLTAFSRPVKMTVVQLSVEESSGIYFIKPEGEMVSGEGDQQLKEVLAPLLSEGRTRIVIDFSGVPYIDSSVLGQLVHCHSQLRLQGGELKILSPSTRVRNLLELTRLITVFDIFEERKDVEESWGFRGEDDRDR